MKTLKKLIVPAAVLAVAIIAYFIATGIAKRAERSNTAQEQPEINVFSKALSDLKTVSFKSDRYDIAIEKSDERYYLAGDRGFPMNQTSAGYFFSAVTGITSSGSLDGSGNLAEYGLDEPKASLTILASDGTTVIYVGDYNKYSDSYYCRLNEENTVYFLESDFLYNFEYSLSDLIVNETVDSPVNGIEDVTKITVEGEGKTLEYRFVPEIQAETNEDGNEITAAADARFDLYDGDGNLIGEATAEGESIYDIVFKSAFTDWIEYNVTEEEQLDKYGLKTPACTVTVYYTATVTVSADDSSSTVTKVVEKTASVLIGNRVQTEDGSEEAETGEEENPAETSEYDRYVKIAEGKIVYVLPESKLESVVGTAN